MYPNASSPQESIQQALDCGSTGCLFNVSADEGEHHNLADSMPDLLTTLGARLDELKKGIWQNNERGVDACPSNITGLCACWMAEHVYGGFMGALFYLCPFFCFVFVFYVLLNCRLCWRV